MHNIPLSLVVNSFWIVSTLLAFSRWNQLDRRYKPLMVYPLFFLIGCWSQYLMAVYYRNNAPVYNFFSLLVYPLVLWQFYLWDLFRGRKYLLITVFTSFTVLWILENLVMNNLLSFNTLHSIPKSLVTALLGISMVNRLIIAEKQSLIKNPAFIASVMWIVYFTYSAVLEIFYYYGLMNNSTLGANLFQIQLYINYATIFLFIYIILRIPRKQRFLLPHYPSLRLAK